MPMDMLWDQSLGVLILYFSLFDEALFGTITKCMDLAGVPLSLITGFTIKLNVMHVISESLCSQYDGT